MDSYNELSSLINQLINLFVYRQDFLLYTNETQDRSNVLLQKIAMLSNTFGSMTKNERRNIREDLAIIDSVSGEKRELIDIDSIDARVKSVLKSNNIYSCLKSLALSNKCAHSFDGNIEKTEELFKKYYNMLYSDKIGSERITFFESLSSRFPKIKNNYLYDLSNISDYQFEKLCNIILNGSKNYKRKVKITVLKQLNVSFDVGDVQNIEYEFNNVINNKYNIIDAFLVKKYNEGVKYTKLQNKMFAIKDNYISMIGQLLAKEKLNNIKYELVKPDDAKPGFEYMLIIDDTELSYYIEVHMPNFIANSLIQDYGLVVSRNRTTQNLGASAVYTRDWKEVGEIRRALRNNSFNDSRALTRAEIISRGNAVDIPPFDARSDDFDNKEVVQTEDIDTEYGFVTRKISEKSSEFENYLKAKNMFLSDIEDNKLIKYNENYSENITNKIVNNNYLEIYNLFDYTDKLEFIMYAFNNIKNEDIFDKYLFDKLKYGLLDCNMDQFEIDNIAKTIICKNKLKRDFVNKNIDKIKKMVLPNKKQKNLNNRYNDIDYDNYYDLTNDNKKEIDLLIDDYIDNYMTNYMDNEVDKEIDDDGPKLTR